MENSTSILFIDALPVAHSTDVGALMRQAWEILGPGIEAGEDIPCISSISPVSFEEFSSLDWHGGIFSPACGDIYDADGGFHTVYVLEDIWYGGDMLSQNQQDGERFFGLAPYDVEAAYREYVSENGIESSNAPD